MHRSAAKCLMIASIFAGSVATGWTQGVDGQKQYLTNCAVCHGFDGKGSLSKGRKSKPPDLTTIARRSSGVFSHKDVYQMIDGRKSPRAHRDMPIWGCRHRPPPAKWEKKPKPDDYERLLDLPCPPEEDIRSRIQAIVDYLSQIQVK